MEKREKIFLNLTNGLEALENYWLNPNEIHFVRLQSSHCEAHKFDEIIFELDSNFLMFAAMGFICKVYDFGARAESPKAVYLGLEWVRYALSRRWLGITIVPVVKSKRLDKYFDKRYKELSRKTKKKLDYFKKFLTTDEIRIEGIAASTDKDNNMDYYRQIAEKWFSERNE